MTPVSAHLAAIEAEIRSLHFGSRPASLYEPIRYIMRLGGKRLRPLLTLMAYELYLDRNERIVPYAVAVEAFHNFTLMHDDIMDKAPLRRGKPTVHERWNVDTAILSGDVMLVRVYNLFLGLPDPTLRQVLSAFNHCATEVCEGQQMDMEFASRKRVSEKEYLEMIRLKTAVLLGFSLELGALLAGASEADRLALREFGTLIGIGFQLKDDILDVYAPAGKFGKQVGGDIVANKKTYLLIKALEKARGANRTSLDRWLRAKKFNPKAKVSAVTAIYDSLDIRRQAEEKVNEFFDKGFAALDRVSVAGKRKEMLASFTRSLIDRQA
jgi:geranylgeranyl diphosphate synthase type II